MFQKGALIKKHKDFEIKKRPKKGYCRLILKGSRCNEEVFSRGVCKKCLGRLYYYGLLDTYALPPANEYIKKFTLNKRHHPDQCRMKRDGEICIGEISRRGLCSKCAAALKARGEYETFAIEPKIPYDAKYTLNQDAGPYECRMLTEGVTCSVTIHTRGLCKKHYRLARYKGVVKKFALPAYVNKKRAIGVRNYNYSENSNQNN